MLSKITEKNKEAEKKIQENIFRLIDENKSIIFNAGAGAGKTYALIKSLKYIIKKYGNQLKIHNQYIICITYTNVATQKIRKELGNSDLVKVSTIHERIWDLIKDYQSELVTIHAGKVKKEIKEISSDLASNSKYEKFQILSIGLKENFSTLMLKNKELFYEKQNLKSSEFRSEFLTLLEDFPKILKNIGNFKSLVNLIYRLKNYEKCLVEIDAKNSGYTRVKYNVIYNTDRLHWMRISHDTLLEYGKEIINNFELLQQIIIDKYPYFLVDEFQDTNKKVVEILHILSQYSLKIQHPFFVGYFGDSAQNIYGDGVGSNISMIHSSLEKVNKEYNRRSSQEIIDVINEIRNDEIKQQSIYEDSEGGSFKFYTGTRNDIDIFLNDYTKKWKITSANKLHCFVLTNKSAAEYSGFGNIFNFFQQTPKYKLGYKQLSTEVMSDNKSQLGKIPSFLLGLIDFRNKLANEETLIKELLSKDIYRSMNIKSLRSFIQTLKKCNRTTLIEFIKSLIELYKTDISDNYKSLLHQLFDYEGFPNKSVEGYLLESLYPGIKDEEIEESKKQVTAFLNIDLPTYDLWYKYTGGIFSKNTIFHTYHSTKGLEFDNVIILMENSFGKNRSYFKDYFNELLKNTALPSEFEHTKNLLYVACSRSIKNLRVLYLDEISDFKAGVQKIFPLIESYEVK